MAGLRYRCLACQAIFRNHHQRCPFDGEPLMILDEEPLRGQLFADRYIIEACIGEGGMGRVYRARHRWVSRSFAIKVLFGDYAADPVMSERFYREADMASRLAHPNVLSVLDFGRTLQNHLYLVMEYIEGKELAKVISTESPLSMDRISAILRQLCLGLAYAHDRGLVHRDFKSENILLSRGEGTETAHIVDFGFALSSDLADERRLTREGVVVGTPAYMSPEQCSGRPLDHRSDLYSLGVVLYHMLSGALPFHGPPMVLIRKHIRETPPPICEKAPGIVVDEHLAAIAWKLLAKDPAERFQHAREVLAALDAAVPADARKPVAPAPAPQVPAPATRLPEPRNIVAPVVRLPESTNLTVALDNPPTRPVRREMAGLLAAAVVVAALYFFVIERSVLPAKVAQSPSFEPTVAMHAPTPVRAVAAAVPLAQPEAARPEAATRVATHEEVATPSARSPEATGADARPRHDSSRPAEDKQPAARANPGSNVSQPSRKKPTAAPKAQELSMKDVLALYKEVGEELHQLTLRSGPAATKAYQESYFAISLEHATRSESSRQTAYETLRTLKQKLRRAQAGAR